MRIRIINPNTTAAMTAIIAQAAREAAGASTQVEVVTSTTGPVSIEGYYDEALCLPGLLKEVRRGESEGADAHVIAAAVELGGGLAVTTDADDLGRLAAAYRNVTVIGLP